MIRAFVALFKQPFMQVVWHDVLITAPVWVPLLFVILWFETWIYYKQRQWIKEKGGVLLEVRLPREQLKSPASMEIFLNTLHQIGVGTLVDVYLKGRVRPWFSLEIASIDGAVHFYIWTHPDYKSRVESQLYAQFPGLEIQEVADYALAVHHDTEKLTFGWFSQFQLNKKNPYPIKTYINYGLDKDPKEEYKIDPLTSALEFLGSMRKGEQAWIQILIQAHLKEGLKYTRLFAKKDWQDDVNSEIKEILKKGRLKPDDDKSLDASKHLSPGQREVIEAIERTSGKTAFDTMIRATYFATKEAFRGENIGGIIGSITQFNSNNLNGFRPGFKAAYDYAWQDPFSKKRPHNERRLLEAYKRRSFFTPPFKNFHGHPFILTTEELATLWHFPSSIVAATPTLERIPSKKSEAPANLPV